MSTNVLRKGNFEYFYLDPSFVDLLIVDFKNGWVIMMFNVKL